MGELPTGDGVAQRPEPTLDLTKSPPSRSFGYVRGLDGVRGVALIMVMLIHGGVSWMAGGFYAVDVFFVLSGFLITTLLLQEYGKRRSISLRDFWIRRSLRLFPAFIAVLLAMSVWVALTVEGDERQVEVADLFSAATYHSNWVMALTGNRDMHPVLLGHTWSLSLEMQFYLIWPLIVVCVLAAIRRLHVSRGTTGPSHRQLALALLAVSTTLAALSAAARSLQTGAGFDWWRIYGGTDTHSDGLLVGCALACIASLGWLGRLPRWVGPLGVIVVAYCVFRSHLMDPWAAHLGFLLVSLGSAAVVAAISAGQWIAKPFSWYPFVYLGRISYGTYLWHFPVYLIYYVDPTTWELSPWRLLTSMGIALGLGSLSFHFIEKPALRLKRRFERTASGRATVTAQIGDSTRNGAAA